MSYLEKRLLMFPTQSCDYTHVQRIVFYVKKSYSWKTCNTNIYYFSNFSKQLYWWLSLVARMFLAQKFRNWPSNSAPKVYGGLLHENISTSSLLRQFSTVQLISKRRESRYLISLVLSKCNDRLTQWNSVGGCIQLLHVNSTQLPFISVDNIND